VGQNKPSKRVVKSSGHSQIVTIKSLAQYLKLSPATVSLVINQTEKAQSFPEHTRNRILAAAKKFNYRPNFVARSLRKQQTLTIGVLVPEISEGYGSMVMAGIEDFLLKSGYFYFVVSHHHKQHLLNEYQRLFLERLVEGLIVVDTVLAEDFPIPMVAVSGHRRVTGVTNVVLDHRRAAALALHHLAQLGHRRIAFIKGQSFSSDTEIRWNSIRHAARELGITIDPELITQLEADSPSPEPGYDVTRRLLAKKDEFTALFTFNDVSAIGAIRALLDHGLRVPQDVSVVGFDDIQNAAFQNPRLTTVRQPLRRMGELAAETLLKRIGGAKSYPKVIAVEPELVIRESTAAPLLPDLLNDSQDATSARRER
jgi:DNA-binding LacI/PurR family transcriptional regulator